MKKRHNHTKALWRTRADKALAEYQSELDRMEERQKLYDGDRTIPAVEGKKHPKKTRYLRNLIFELIETQISSDIPMPKVTPKRARDEPLAKLIEAFLRNEVDRLRMESMHDRQQRTVPIQGGSHWHGEWDNSQRSHGTVGAFALTDVHPRQVIPQPGVTSDIEDMDYIFLTLPQTKGGIRRRYGVDLGGESEELPELRGETATDAEDMVTQWIVYYRTDSGGIGRYSWVNDIELEDYPDYQARRLRRCAGCDAVEPAEDVTPTERQTGDGTWDGGVELPEEVELPTPGAKAGRGRKVCPYCGGTVWQEREQEYEEFWETLEVMRPDGRALTIGPREITGPTGLINPDTGLPEVGVVKREPAKVPYYKPNVYPVVRWINVSKDRSYLGSSDVDQIRDAQMETNRLSEQINQKLDGGGTLITLPPTAIIETSETGIQFIRLEAPDEKGYIDVYTLQGDVTQDMEARAQTYEEARQALGVTDSFQGRRDPTATSGVAKEFSANRTVGRLESKRIMEDEAFSRLYELMFKFYLAYADEERPVVSYDATGAQEYREFSRYFFLETDEAGEWYWNDEFLFSVDTAAPLASNREAMWQETRSHFEAGAFGNPLELDTQIVYWSKMSMLHYPGAEDTISALKKRKQEQTAMMAAAPVMNQPPVPEAAPV